MKLPLCLSILVVASVFSCYCLSANAGDFANSAVSNPSEAAATSPPGDGPVMGSSEFMIPGPLRSFLRMAGISQKIAPEQVLPLLSRNVFVQGYEGSKKQTEFLILLSRYVVQAKELSALAATDGMIRVSNCDDARPLLRILGYRTRPNCGEADTSLQTADPERAFLTIDSGFPLPELEQTLQGGKPFAYPYAASASAGAVRHRRLDHGQQEELQGNQQGPDGHNPERSGRGAPLLGPFQAGFRNQ